MAGASLHGLSEIRSDTRLAPGVYHLPDGLRILSDGVTLDGGGALLVGSDRRGEGVRIEGRSGVTVRNLRLREYRHGIVARDCRGVTVQGVQVASTAEELPNTLFLDIWRPAEEPYGAGILLVRVTDSLVEDNDLQHQQNGLLTYHCARLTVLRNQAGYNSGFGFHLFGTCDSRFEENCADFCCRFQPREGGLHHGHLGADAAGFLAVAGSCRNRFLRNTARMGGDGFFLAGLSPDGVKAGCDDNLFEENDATGSPNIAFEATFCRGNLFRHNLADRSNYGFWLGFSWDTRLEENRMVHNRQAGIAVENGHSFHVRENSVQANGHGILLWSRRVASFAAAFPESLTSYDWLIENNRFLRNGVGIRIAADQDHGIRPLPEAERGLPGSRPRDHRIRGNEFHDNRVGVELIRTDDTFLEQNTLHRNVEAHLREEDCERTVRVQNLGLAGGYL